MTVLVTGAGGPAGVAVIRALAAYGEKVIAVDADPLAVGLRLGHESAVVPAAGTPGFADALMAISRRWGVDALVTTVAEELAALARLRAPLERAGVATWIPDPGAVARCIDKWRFALAVQPADVVSPATGLGNADGIPGPWVVKPRFGRGSRDVVFADDDADVAWALRRVPDPIVQTRLAGPEFTVDALVDRSGALVAAVPRWRLETKAGISTKGRTFVDDRLTAVVQATLRAVGLDGPANVQGFATPTGYAVTEVNPRFSGGLPLSLAAGADLVGEYLRGMRGEPLRPERLRHRGGVLMLRHFEECFEDGLDGQAGRT